MATTCKGFVSDLYANNCASLRLGLQLGKVGVQLVFGNAFALVRLIDAAFDFRANSALVFHQPAILLFLRFEKAEQRFFRTGGRSP